jgi:hypothetical protein
VSVHQFGSNRAAEQKPTTAIDQRNLGSYEAAVAGAVPSRYTDQA